MEDGKQIYIVLSQTGTILSKLLKCITHDEYNHASIAFSQNLSFMYSFGRKWAYNPFFAGFVKESRNYGTFKRFSTADLIVLSVNVSEEQYREMCSKIDEMLRIKRKFRYNYFGLLIAAFNKPVTRKNRFYCSEFVRYMLKSYNVDGSENLAPITKPVDFLSLPSSVVYKGRLCDYTA